MLNHWLGPDPQKWAPLVRNPLGDGDISIVPLRLGLQGEIGVIVAGSQRADFPGQTETTSSERGGESGGDRAAGGTAPERTEADRQRTRSTGRATNPRTCRSQRRAEEGNCRTQAGGREATAGGRELKRSEARKAAILDSALDCIVTIDHEGCITEFNPAAERTFGYRRDEVVGKHLADVIIPPSLRERHRRGFARYLATGEARVLGRRIEMTAIRADGSEFPVELAITRIPLDGPPSFTGYLRDITERKRAEEELRRSEAFLAEGQRLSVTGSFSWRVLTDEITWSEQLYRIFEFDLRMPVTFALIGTRVHPEDLPSLNRHDRPGARRRRRLRKRVSAAHARSLGQVPAPGGSREPRSAGSTRIHRRGQDVTQRRLSEEALGETRSELAHVARVTSLGALTASIAHEVNQPLSGIITNASTCLRMLAADPPNVDGARETARRTIRDGNRASDVVTRLRALFSKKADCDGGGGPERGCAGSDCAVVERTAEKPGDSAAGTCRRPARRHRRSCPTAAGDPEPAPERRRRDERRRRSPAAAGDQNRTRRMAIVCA